MKRKEKIEVKYLSCLDFNARNAFDSGLDEKEAKKQRKYYQALSKRELNKKRPRIYLPFLVIRGKRGEVAYVKNDRSDSKILKGKLVLEVFLFLSAQEKNKWAQIATNVFKTAYLKEYEIASDNKEFKGITEGVYREVKLAVGKGRVKKARFRTFEDKAKWGSCTKGSERRKWRNKEMRKYWKEMKEILRPAKIHNIKLWLKRQNVWEDTNGHKKLSDQTIIHICQGGK